MRDKTKKTKKEIKPRDLKPVKDPKGGLPAVQRPSLPAVQGPIGNK